MKRYVKADEINNWPAKHRIDYFGRRFYPPHYLRPITVNGNFMAAKYNAILKAIKEVNGRPHLKKDCILIEHDNGHFKIGRDLMVDSFLFPAINLNFGFDSIEI